MATRPEDEGWLQQDPQVTQMDLFGLALDPAIEVIIQNMAARTPKQLLAMGYISEKLSDDIIIERLGIKSEQLKSFLQTLYDGLKVPCGNKTRPVSEAWRRQYVVLAVARVPKDHQGIWILSDPKAKVGWNLHERVGRHVARQLSALPTELGLLPHQFAQQAGISLQALRDYQQYKKRITAGLLGQIAIQVGVPVTRFYAGFPDLSVGPLNLGSTKDT